jgi:hypothetical protein
MTEVRKGEGGIRRFGVVLFNNPEDPKVGWASIAGEPSQEITSAHELPGDTLWLTNLGYEEFRNSKLYLNPWLRADYYLPIKFKDLMAEWGVSPADSPHAYTASFSSTLFQRIMSIAWRLMKENNPGLDRSRAFLAPSLREDLRVLVPKLDYPTDDAWHVLTKGQAMKDFTPLSIRAPKGGKSFMLRRPRLSHALDLLASPVPKGNFEWVSKNAMRGMDRVAWVRQCERPLMVNASHLGLLNNGAGSEIADVFGYGNNADKKNAVQRNWMAHPEFMVMSSFAKLDVMGAWRAQEYQCLNLLLSPTVTEFLSNRYSEMSWSAGIVAEALLRATFLGDPSPKKNIPGEAERPNVSWQGVWLKAIDRMMMFTTAMSLHRAGFSVQSYGVGWVQCSVTDDQIPDLVHEAMSLGLVPRYLDIPDGLFQPNQPLPWNGDTRGAGFAGLVARKNQKMLWNLDRIPMSEKERQDGLFKKIVEMASK